MESSVFTTAQFIHLIKPYISVQGKKHSEQRHVQVYYIANTQCQQLVLTDTSFYFLL